MFHNLCLSCVAEADPRDLLAFLFGPEAAVPAEIVIADGTAVRP